MLSGAMLSRAGRLPAWFRFASVFLALLLLFLSTSPTGAQSLGAWTRVSILPAGTAAVALATDGTVYRLDSGGQLWRRSSDTTPWSSYLTTLLPDARGIAVAAGVVFYQRADSSLWSIGRTDIAQRIGRPHAAAEITATESTDLPVLYALNDDRTFWRNGSGGVDGSWQRMGSIDAANKITATANAVLALKADGSIWINRNEGRTENWQRVGTAADTGAPSSVVGFTAAVRGTTTEIVLYVLQGDRTLWKASIDPGIVTGIPAPTATRVDLRAKQTRLKDQVDRRSCITFAAIAALEAAYKRAGYGDLDLSEEFLNHFGKMFWLHPAWTTWDDFMSRVGSKTTSPKTSWAEPAAATAPPISRA